MIVAFPSKVLHDLAIFLDFIGHPLTVKFV